MSRSISKTISILLSILIMIAFMPAEAGWAVSDDLSDGITEAAGDTAASVGSDAAEEASEAVSEDVSDDDDITIISGDQQETVTGDETTDEEDNEINEETETEDDDTVNDADDPEGDTEHEGKPIPVKAMDGGGKDVEVDDSIVNGSIELSETEDGFSGTAIPDDGYDLASIRQIRTDTENVEHEQYLEYTQKADGSYSFTVTAVDDPSVVTAFFYDTEKWDGAVDLTWYDPDETVFEISTPAQLAGLAAITNGMVDNNVTEEYMIKDPAGRSFDNGMYSHRYVSTESAEADLLTPNNAEGAGQIRDVVWRLPAVEHRKLGEDDVHNDFLYRTVKLTADIDMGDKNWTPIGGKYAMNRNATGDEDPKVIDTRFQGIFDGQGHTVTINCDRMAEKGFAYAMEIALIGYLGGGVDYKNGYPKDTYMDYDEYWVPTVRNVIVKGDIKGRRMVGGVVGRTGETNYGVLVESCANYADVYATDMRGCAGIVGAAWGKAMIRNCYNAGTIHSTYWEHGGIIGSNGYEGSSGRKSAGADIYNCYNIGAICKYERSTDSWVYDGQEIGVDGQAFAAYTVSNCYYPEPESVLEGKTGYSIEGDSSVNKKVRLSAVESADLRSDETLDKLNANGTVFVKDTAGINGGYPLLWFQDDPGSGTATVTLSQSEGGTIGFKEYNGNILNNIAYGTTVELSASPERGKRLTGYKVTADSFEKMIPSNGFYTVTGTDVTIEGVFEDRSPSMIRFVEENDGAPYYIKVEKVHDGATDSVCDPAIVLKSGDQVEKDDVIRITPVDIRLAQTQPDIKYLEYTGKFNDPAFPDWSLDVEDKTRKLYRVTGDVEEVDISVDPKTQGKQWTTVADISWYRAGTKRFTITTAKQLAGLAKLCNDGNSFEGVTILLGNDICLDNNTVNSGDIYGYERSWVGIGSNERYAFKGTFDGQGHTIKYMHRNFAPGYCGGDNGGLFGVTNGAVIKNVNVESGSYINEQYGVTMNCEFKNGANGGSIVGTAIDTRIENCSGSVSMDRAFSAGGIVGIAEGNTVVVRCTSESSIYATGESVGGIVGKIDDDGVQIADCVNNGDIKSNSWKVGGILGSSDSYSGSITRCVNNGSVGAYMSSGKTAMQAIGGVAGYLGGSVKCVQCINRGEVRGSGKAFAVGGIAGSVIRGTVEECYNTGEVYSESASDNAQLAGIANTGSNRYMNATVKNCYNSGTVTAGSGFVSNNYGGAVAYGSTTSNVLINVYCTNASVATIDGKAGAAGTVVTDEELKNLNVDLGGLFIVDRGLYNNGFPVLAWQDPSAIAVMKSASAAKSGSKAAKVTWKAAGPLEGFEVQRSVNGGGFTKVYSGSDSGYVDKGLAEGSKYTYRVRPYLTVSFNQMRYGDWKTAGVVQVLPPAMKISSVKNSKKGSAVIKWKRVKNAAGYVIYRSTSKKGNYKKTATVKVTKKNKSKKTLSFTNKKLKKKKTYYYKIVYYKKIGGKTVYSEMSAPKAVKIKK